MESAEYLSDSGQAQLQAPTDHTIDVLERVGLYRQRRGLGPLRFGDLETVAADLKANGRDPVRYVCELFNKHQVVFIGHQIPSRRTGLFLAELVRALPDWGVHHVAMEYLCRDDQRLLDAVTGAGATSVTAGGEAFAETLACEAMLRWGLRHGFAFREYLDLLATVWELNCGASGVSGMPGTSGMSSVSGTRMRVLGLDYDLNFDAVTDTADLRSWFPWKHLRHRGTAARHMCDVLLSEVFDKGHKALVLCRTPHAMTRKHRRPHRIWDAFDTEIDSGQVVGAANHVYAAVADRAATVLIHEPMPADGVLCDYALAADGVLDAVFAMVEGPCAPLGFDTGIGSVGELRCQSALDDGSFASLAQGWVYLEVDQHRTAPAPLRGVISEATLARTRRLALDGYLRRPDANSADFDAAFGAAAAAAELSWTQVL